MAIIDVVKWEANNKEFCHKFPSEDLKTGTQLVVYSAQTAFFVSGGRICDEFSAGTYTLKSDNLPILNKIINIPFGGDSPFQAEVWFVNQISRLDFKWGTPQPIQLEDPKYHIVVPVRAYGQYGIKITDPRLFLEVLIGNMTSFSAESIDSYFRGGMLSVLNTHIANVITRDGISILDVANHLVEISDYCKAEINKYFNRYGISLIDFSVVSITVPPDDPSFVRLKDAKDMAMRMSVMGRDYYQMDRSFTVLEKAAENPGAGGQILGIGMGLGLNPIMSGLAGSTIDINGGSAPPPIPHEVLWHVYVDGRQVPGRTKADIADMISQGVANADTLVWKQGMANWVPIASVPELQGIIPPKPEK